MQDCKSPENDGSTKEFYELKKRSKRSKQGNRKKGQRQTLHKELVSNFSS